MDAGSGHWGVARVPASPPCIIAGNMQSGIGTTKQNKLNVTGRAREAEKRNPGFIEMSN